MDYQVFPRLAAFAEVAWSALPAPAERDFAGFERRMAAHYRAPGRPRCRATGRPAARCPGSDAPAPDGNSARLGRPIDGAPPNV